MPLLEVLITGLGTSIASSIVKIWLKDQPILSEVGQSILDILGKRISDIRSRNATARQIDAIGERAAESVLLMLSKEAEDIPESRLEMVSNAASQTISSTHIDAQLLAERDLQPEALARLFLGRTAAQGGNPGLAGAYDSEFFSKREHEIYFRILEHSSQLIVDIASQFPNFSERVLGEILRRETSLLERSERIADDLDRLLAAQIGDNPHDEVFETAYRSACIRRLDQLELFGVDLQIPNKRYKLSVAYITLEIEKIASYDCGKLQSFDGDRLNEQQFMPVTDILSENNRILVRGPAGSGKTTLLQWIAVFSATRNMPHNLSILNDAVPFLVRLRDYAEDPLPSPEDFPTTISTALGGKPEGWVHRQLTSGNALVLVDGVDEAPESRRDEVRNWLRDLVVQYPNAKYLMTSRPHAAEEGWMNSDGFVDVSLQAMKRDDIYRFVDHWHYAISDGIADVDEKGRVIELAELLKLRLKEDGGLFKIAGSPLLCAILCALHRDRKEDLPKDRIELYRACIEMFFRRDRERKISMEDYPDLSDRQKHRLLQNLAWWLIKNGKSTASPDEITERFDSQIEQLAEQPANISGHGIQQLMVERVGILRKISTSKIDFPHRTFQEYLAAHEAVAENDLGLLVKNAHEDQWREVTILAAGIIGNTKIAEHFIVSLMERGDAEPLFRGSLYTIAAAALQSIIRLPAGNTLKVEVGSRISKIIPPKTMADAKDISGAGEIVVKYLKRKSEFGVRQAACSVRALALIGSETAVDAISTYGQDHRVGVSKEIVAALGSLTEDLANTLGKSIKFLNLSDPSLEDLVQIQRCKYLEKMDFGVWYNNTYMNFLGAFANLKTLVVRGRAVFTSDFDRLVSLQNLTIFHGDLLEDFTFFKNPNLRKIIVESCNNLINIRGIDEVVSLMHLQIFLCPRLVDLKGGVDSKIEILHVMNCEGLLSLAGIEGMPRLRVIELRALRSLVDISPLGSLKELESLKISMCSSISGHQVISDLKKLKYFQIEMDSRLADLSMLEGMDMLERVHIYSCPSLKGLEALYKLKSLRYVILWNCPSINANMIAALKMSNPNLMVNF